MFSSGIERARQHSASTQQTELFSHLTRFPLMPITEKPNLNETPLRNKNMRAPGKRAYYEWLLTVSEEINEESTWLPIAIAHLKSKTYKGFRENDKVFLPGEPFDLST